MFGGFLKKKMFFSENSLNSPVPETLSIIKLKA